MDETLAKMHADVCKAFSNHRRIQIIFLLGKDEMNVSSISKSLRLPQPLVSQHLAGLRQKGVVLSRRSGNRTLCRISNPKIIKACDLMRQVLLERIGSTGRLTRKVRK